MIFCRCRFANRLNRLYLIAFVRRQSNLPYSAKPKPLQCGSRLIVNKFHTSFAVPDTFTTTLIIRRYCASSKSENMGNEGEQQYGTLPEEKVTVEEEPETEKEENLASDGENTEMDTEEDAEEIITHPELVKRFGKDRVASEIMEHELSEEQKEKLVTIEAKYNFLKKIGEKVPDTLTDFMLLDLLFHWNTKKLIKNRLKFYYYKEAAYKKRKRGKETKNSQRLEMLEEREKNEWKPTLMLKVNRDKIVAFRQWKACQAMLYGPPIIVDLDYEKFMRYPEIRRAAQQLHDVYCKNKRHDHPYHLIYCNASKGRTVLDTMAYETKCKSDEDFYITITDKHYLDLGYNRSNLVYLSPHSSEDLMHYNPNDVYIIGGFVDTHMLKPISIRKAMEDRIRHAKLPVDLYLQRTGNNEFTIDQMIDIMLELKDTGNMEATLLKHYPKRKMLKYTAKRQYQKEKRF